MDTRIDPLAAFRLRVRDAQILRNAGGRLEPDTDLLAFDDLDASVREDVERIASADALRPGTRVWGAVYDVDSGRLRVVVEPA